MIKTKGVYIDSNSIQRFLIKMLSTLDTDFTKKIQKSTYLQNRNNKDLNFGLSCFRKTEHFSH